MSKWQQVKLGDIASNIQTGPFGSQLHQSDYSESGTPVVMPKDLVKGKISERSIARVESSHVERLPKHKIQNGDILYSRRGDVGRCAYAGKEETGWLCGTGCLRVTIDVTRAIPKFIFYQLQTSQSVGWVEKHAVGSTMLNLNTSILANVPISLPPIEIQRKVADILSAYDDLIENNRKQIKLLEEAAQRLYKEWFIDLRFPGYESTPIIDGIPEGWKKQSVGTLLSKINRTKQVQTADYLAEGLFPIIDQSKNFIAGYTNDAETIIQNDQPIIVFGDHTRILKLISFEFAKGADGTQLIISNNKKMPQHLLFCALKEIDLSNYHYARHFKYLKTEEILIPSQDIADKIEIQLSDFFEKIQCCRDKIHNASKARNILLPKLMTGELEVK